MLAPPRRCAAALVQSHSRRWLATTSHAMEKKVYVIAGEASGDAIGAKVITALRRLEQSQRVDATESPRSRLVFRGIGGPQMCAAGDFDSLFGMQELSVMGLVEVLPYLWRLRRRLHDTVADIRAFQPDVLLTIDSKGFTFRVQRALKADAFLRDSCARMHYVAPSVWAYKHRRRQLDAELKANSIQSEGDDGGNKEGGLERLLHKMFVILPFEPKMFNRKSHPDYCLFVGHPVVEDFLEYHQLFDEEKFASLLAAATTNNTAPEKQSSVNGNHDLQISAGGLVTASCVDSKQIERRGHVFTALMTKNTSDRGVKRRFREEMGLPTDGILVCALVGSRDHEVRKTIRTVLEAVTALQHRHATQKITVVFPSISSVQACVKQELESCAPSMRNNLHVVVDCDTATRFQLFQSADAAVAVSGTIVMETTMAALPTVVIYRANRVSEWLARRLSAVQFVSIPNLLLGRPVLPELLFSDCTAENITLALTGFLQNRDAGHAWTEEASQLGMVMSTLLPWADNGTPRRGSDRVAQEIWHTLAKPINRPS